MASDLHHILAGWLIDGGGGPIREKMVLSVANGTIASIGEYREGDFPNGENLTDLGRCIILPPLIDSHVHLCMSGTIDPATRTAQLELDCEELLPVVAEHLGQQFSHGVLGVRDGGDRFGCVKRYLDEPSTQPRPEVLVKTPGRAYHQRDRYGSLIGGGPVEDESLVESYLRHNQSADHVKVVHSGLNSLTDFAYQSPPQFTVEELRDLVVRAHQHDRTVMVHANGALPVSQALEAGCDSIEHGFFMGRDNIERMAELGTYWIPTVYTMKACVEHIEHCLTEADRGVVERNLAHQVEQLSYARECGVKVALGTDAGSIGVLHGEAVVEELKLFLQAGFSLPEAIRCATEHGAQLIGSPDTYGQIRVGKPAHFIAARGTPGQLPRKLTYLEAIYLHGEPAQAYRKFHRDIPDHRV